MQRPRETASLPPSLLLTSFSSVAPESWFEHLKQHRGVCSPPGLGGVEFQWLQFGTESKRSTLGTWTLRFARWVRPICSLKKAWNHSPDMKLQGAESAPPANSVKENINHKWIHFSDPYPGLQLGLDSSSWGVWPGCVRWEKERSQWVFNAGFLKWWRTWWSLDKEQSASEWQELPAKRTGQAEAVEKLPCTDSRTGKDLDQRQRVSNRQVKGGLHTLLCGSKNISEQQRVESWLPGTGGNGAILGKVYRLPVRRWAYSGI